MSVPTQDFIWQQGEDGNISLVYKDNAGNPINLTGYNLRMDITDPTTGSVLYTYNTTGSGPAGDTVVEATLGSDGSINIVVDRSETLNGTPAGALYNKIGAALNYDIFLRTPSGSGAKQTKILKGTITIEKSYTLWS